MYSASKTWVEISSSALTQNIRTIQRELTQGTQLMAVIKSNAYGHGLLQVAKVADQAGVEWFGVDNANEAFQLRAAGFRQRLLILGYVLPVDLEQCRVLEISFVFYTRTLLRHMHAICSRLSTRERTCRPFRVHLKVETGTSRQGISETDLPSLVRAASRTEGIRLEGVSTHYANIEDTTDRTHADLQLQRFREALAMLEKQGIRPPVRHTACSAATLLYPETHFDLVRVGISLYGLWSSEYIAQSENVFRRKIILKPALEWKTRIAQVKSIPQGTPVSYGLTEKVTRDSRIAVLPVGYWDGYDRKLSGIGQVVVRGTRCKIIGRICMNMCMIDVTDVPGVREEEEVFLIGQHKRTSVSADDLAHWLQTIHYEIVTRINPLLPRILV